MSADNHRLLALIAFVIFFLTGVATHSAAADEGPDNWPSFRGNHASGVADGQDLPAVFGGDSLKNVAWKHRIPGLAHSSPVIWGNRLFVTSAISSEQDASFTHGLYGSGDASPDQSAHVWKVYCLDKSSGSLSWDAVATRGIPKDKRHIKATYANSSPATDGRYLVAFFGSQGVFAFNMAGDLLWQRDLGRLNVGAYDAPGYEWGSASSPVIFEDFVLLQCDTQGSDFLIALNLADGTTAWRTAREELPSWATPTVYDGTDRVQIIANGSNFICGYDAASGAELWRLAGSSKITAPTPVFKDDLIIVASGRSPEKPIFAIRAQATGDICLADGQTSNSSVAWSWRGRGPYMPTPVIYGDYLYILSNRGVLDCYEFKTGKDVYRQRLSHRGGGFSASPVASDGKLYLSGEDGDVFVVRTGPEYELLAHNQLQERLMASPAISGGQIYFRTEHSLYAVGRDSD